jgi:hypothetical protein
MEALAAAGAADVVRLALRGSTSVTGVQRRGRPGAGVAGAGRGAAAGGRGHRRGGWVAGAALPSLVRLAPSGCEKKPSRIRRHVHSSQ